MIDVVFFDIMRKFASAEGEITLAQPLSGQGYLAAYLERDGFSTKIHQVFVEKNGIFKLNKEKKIDTHRYREATIRRKPKDCCLWAYHPLL